MSNLTIKNNSITTEVFSKNITYSFSGRFNKSLIRNADVDAVEIASSFLYNSDDLVFSFNLTPIERFFSHTFQTSDIRISALFKKTNTTENKIDAFQEYNVLFDVILFQPNKLVVKLRTASFDEIRNDFNSSGLVLPNFGMLAFQLNLRSAAPLNSILNTVVLTKMSTLPIYSSLLLEPNSGSILGIGISTYKTPPYSSENLFIPTLSGALIYNFFEPTEEDYEVYRQRNYAGAKITDIPKYIKLNWNRPGIFNLQATTPVVPFPTGALGVIDNGMTAQPPRMEFPDSPLGSIAIGGVVVSLPQQDEMATALGGSPTRSSGLYSDVFDGRVDVNTDPSADDDEVIALPGSSAIGIGGFNVDGTNFGARDTVPDLEFNTYTESDYIGYVIQKTRITQEGDVSTVDLIPIETREVNEFIDWKIAYGETYEYKIRSIFRFVNKNNVNIYYDSDSLLSQRQASQFVDDSRISFTYSGYYYDSEFSNKLNLLVLEFERPDPPFNIKCFPNSKYKNIFISWNQKNPDRDVVGYNVYRRLKNTKFVKLNSQLLDVRENKYNDFDIETNVPYIYAIEAVDFHGNFSKMSAQYSILTVDYNNFSNCFCEEKQKLINSINIEIGEELQVEQKELPLIFKENFDVNVNPLFLNTYDKDTFVLKITSLDTGLIKELKINFNTLTIYHVRPYTPDPPEFIQFLLPLDLGAIL